jgi:mannose-1-phosphate guanylyltransferase/mannose-1-phosphate guanylyltransferase/mannose-6-phosphate isomerase
MFQMTLKRVSDRPQYDTPIIVANARHQDLIDAQISEIGLIGADLLLEPCARNTAPAIALAALACDNRATPLLVMPSDHVIQDVDAFHQAIAAATPYVEAGWLATFGISPTGPETGYGYIAMGNEMDASVREIISFVEKPELARAEAMIADGNHVWNGGIFLFRADIFLAALERFAPEILAACEKAMAAAVHEENRILPDADFFAQSPAESIDYAVMEKADRVCVVPVAMGWSDVGSWDALYELGTQSEAASEIGCTGNLVRSDGLNIHLAGVSDMIVVASGRDVLIVPRGQSQNVKLIVAELEQNS